MSNLRDVVFDSYCSYLAYRLNAENIREVYLYGTGDCAKKLLAFFSATGISVAALLDDGYGQIERSIFNICVLKTEEIRQTLKPIIIASQDYQDVIFDRLLAMGIEQKYIFKVFIQADPRSVEKRRTLSPQKAVDKKIKTVVFIGDNTDTLNFGCRATSAALMDILSQSVTITDKMKRNELVNLFAAIPLCDDWPLYMSAVREFNRSVFEDLICRIKKADAVVMNGEGTFIFMSPPRLDLHNYLIVLSACMEAERPFYVLNFMFSSYPSEPMNVNLTEQALHILEHARLVTVRDLESKRIIERQNCKINLDFVPDALFTWHTIFSDNKKLFKTMLAHPHFALPFAESDAFYNQLDFNTPYVLLSGNSYGAHYKPRYLKAFAALAPALKESAEKLGLNFYLIECCAGDSALRDVALQTGIPLIPVTTNIYLAGYILGSARCFITGRYHPAILASLGGTPCVFMGANSHKTASLQTVLAIPPDRQLTFSAIPEEDEIPRIVGAFETAIERHNRRRLEAVCKKNALLAYSIAARLED